MTYEEYKSAVEERVFNNLKVITGIVRGPKLLRVHIQSHYENAMPAEDMAAIITKRMLKAYSYDPKYFRFLYPDLYS